MMYSSKDKKMPCEQMGSAARSMKKKAKKRSPKRRSLLKKLSSGIKKRSSVRIARRTSRRMSRRKVRSSTRRSSKDMESKIAKRKYRLKMLSKKKKISSPRSMISVQTPRISMKKYSKKACPIGSISRKSYTRKSGVKVEATCVESKGVRSKGLKPKVILPKLKEGSLLKYGYNLHESDALRHAALKTAVKKYGFSSTIKKLNAVRVLSKNIAPENSKIYEKDIRYIEKNLVAMP